MSTAADLSATLGRQIVSEIAPEESAMFDHFARRFDAGASGPAFLDREEHQGGSGLPGSDVIITYVVLTLLQPVVKSITDGALQAIKETSQDTVRSILKPYAAELRARLTSLIPAKKNDKKVTALKSYVDELDSAGQGTATR